MKPVGLMVAGLLAAAIAAPAIAPVPEPTTWAMLILGLAGAGAALRRRSSRVAARTQSRRARSTWLGATRYLAIVACVVASPAMAAQVVDQQHIVPSDSVYALPFGFDDPGFRFRRVQTVTVGVAGTLSQVDVQYQPTLGAPVFTGFNIYAAGADGVPTYTLLGSGSLIGEGGGWASFATNLAVSLGQTVALEPTYIFAAARPFSTSGWLYDPNMLGGYPGGTSYDSINGGNFAAAGIDVGFRTYVTPNADPEPTGVPEPATWAMMLGGFGLVGAAMRRRHRHRAIA